MDLNFLKKDPEDQKKMSDLSVFGKVLAILGVLLTGAMIVLLIMYVVFKKDVITLLLPCVALFWIVEACLNSIQGRSGKLYLTGAALMMFAEVYYVFFR